MSKILTYLSQIISARYGKDVRQSIHDAIHQCYEDGKAGSIDLVAREQINSLLYDKVGHPDYSKNETLFTLDPFDRQKSVAIEEDGFVFLNYEFSFKNLAAEPNDFDISLSINENSVFVASETIDKEFYKGTSPLYPVKAGDLVKVQGGSRRLDMVNCEFYPLLKSENTEEFFEGGIILTDTVTGTLYKLSAADGKLTMEEVIG